MKSSIRRIEGNWDLGYVLDKHVLSSTYLGENAQGHPQFDTTRSEVGEALFRLKYRSDWSQIDPLARELAVSIYPKFDTVEILIPMPPSNRRVKQPVTALAEALGRLVDRPVFEGLLIKRADGKQLKDLHSKLEKVEALEGSFSVQDQIEGNGPWNALLVDDLFDTGASLEEACAALRTYPKIRKIYVAALTWK